MADGAISAARLAPRVTTAPFLRPEGNVSETLPLRNRKRGRARRGTAIGIDLSKRNQKMSGSTARLQAVSAITSYVPGSPPLNFKETPAEELFGANVFGLSTMQKVLPPDVFQSLKKTIETGSALDANVADAVAKAMKEWAI